MTMPTQTKTWYATRTSINLQVYNTILKVNQACLYQIKQALITGASGNWTVSRSSGKNGDTSMTSGAADYWLQAEDVVFHSTSDRSWIVLKQTALGSGIEILISCRATYNYKLNIYLSPSGSFTGGTTTSEPTATDQITLVSYTPTVFDGDAGLASNIAYATNATILKTTDGTCTRVIVRQGNGAGKEWIFETPKNAKTWWTTPWIGGVIDMNYDGLSPATASNSNLWTRIDGENILISFCGEGMGEFILSDWSSIYSIPDSSGNWMIQPMGIVSRSVLRPGKLGEVIDMWWVPDSLPDGQFFTSNGVDRDFVAYRSVLLGGWDGGELG